MKFHPLACCCLIALALMPVGRVSASTTLTGDQDIVSSGAEPGNLTMTGDLSISGSVMNLGTTTGSIQAVQWTYFPSTTPPALTIDLFDATARLVWRQNAAVAAAEKMELTDANQLILFASSYNPTNPDAGIVKLTPSLALGGSTMTLDGQRVLTQADAASFVSSTNGSITGTLSATGTLSVGGNVSVLGGTVGTEVNGTEISYGFALGPGSHASQYGSVAIGKDITSTGAYAIALGNTSSAVGDNATATGASTIANGKLSFSAGYQTVTMSPGQFVIGVNNIAEPATVTASFSLTDPAFVIGNGSDQISAFSPNASQSDAFVVRWNGDATTYGNAHVVKTLTVDQDAAVTGNAQVTGNLDVQGTLTVQPKGGISMGDYTAGP